MFSVIKTFHLSHKHIAIFSNTTLGSAPNMSKFQVLTETSHHNKE